MNWLTAHFVLLVIPLICSNIIHMIIVKFDWLTLLKHPISERSFGINKTWRGLLVVSLLNGFFALITDRVFELEFWYPSFTGFLVGLAYILFELPNSFMKRKLGIPPGEKHPKKKLLFMLFDKMDSPFGVMLVYFSLGMLELKYCALFFISGVAVHISVSQILVIIKLKKSF